MSKCVVTSLACVLPLMAACPADQSPCNELGSNVVIEIDDSSLDQNVGACALPPAFLLGALGCNVAVSYTADKCMVDYALLCIGGVEIDVNVTQKQDDGVVGALHKFDPRSGCSLDLDITLRSAPASTAANSNAS